MTTLTLEALEVCLRNLMDEPEERIALRPTKLIISPEMNHQLRLRPPIRKLRGPRGRIRALKQRRVSLLTRLLIGVTHENVI